MKLIGVAALLVSSTLSPVVAGGGGGGGADTCPLFAYEARGKLGDE